MFGGLAWFGGPLFLCGGGYFASLRSMAKDKCGDPSAALRMTSHIALRMTGPLGFGLAGQGLSGVDREGGTMGYLDATEYVAYGLTAETTDDWVTTASALMESYCRRPSLLVSTYTERVRLGRDGATARLSYLPLAVVAPATTALVSARGRLGHTWRGEMLDSFREQVMQAFCVPGGWTALDVTAMDVDVTTGEVSLPVNFLGLRYTDLEVTYTAGLAEVPAALKVACAQIVRNAQATPALNVRSSKVDRLQMQYFSQSLLDEGVQALLRPYVAERLG